MNGNDLIIGCKVLVSGVYDNTVITRKAEVISIRSTEEKKEYYVHYIGFNKRLDE